ncbi:MAG: glycosyltransferase family 39 protein [Verrucomicrobia bacterium]|nr:glycosyltransferase family 39 protein [Verrucomicrobiota bacterium]
MTATSAPLDTGVIIRRSLFFLVLIALTLGNLFALFRGLDSPQAMDQAQIAREIARGNSFTTKMIRPAAYSQAEAAKKTAIAFTKFEDTYHSPLNPLLTAAVLKLVGADATGTWQMGKNELIFPLDRVIATISTLFFLMAIGVNYLLVSRVFDTRIAAVCAILMLFCESFWNYSLSGLPQMLMLLLFSCAIYFVYRAVEAASEGRIAMTPAIIAGVFFTLLALTHWMTVWIALGYIIFAAIAFRPRGVVAAAILLLILIPAAFVMVRNSGISGSPFGTAYLTLYNGLAGSEDEVMRTVNLQDNLNLNGLFSKIIRVSLLQASDIIPLLAGIVVAPLFFISLLHPFKRQPIATFRWAIFLMWCTTAVGLAFFGVSPKGLDPNQLHLVFAPIMTAYGLAFIAILWSRLDFVIATPSLANVHYFVVVILCALPLVLALPDKIKAGIQNRDKGGFPHWPPYYAPALNLRLKKIVPENQITFSDQPWAVAWYADRISIWLPPDHEGFEKLDNIATELNTSSAGILITPSSYGLNGMLDISAKYKDFTSLVIDGQALVATAPTMTSLYDKDPKIAAALKRYPYRIPLLGYFMTFYGEKPVRTAE